MVTDAEKSSGLMEDDKCGLYESSRTDSGFLSSANLTSDQLLSEEIKSATDSGLIEEDDGGKVDSGYMRLDSGVDVGLSETFSGLSLKSPSLNNLNSTKRTNDDIPHTQTNIKSEQERPPWELYYRQDEEGDTQLHIAIIHGFIEVVYSLIRLAPHPCLLDIVNDYSQTPLHLAVLSRQSRIARRLVAAGASPRCRDLRGNTPLHLACEAGDLETVKEITAPISIQEVESLGLSYGTSVARREIDIEQRNYDGQMCVHLAALGGHVDVLRHLVWLGANINAREGKSGYTPLHQAIENGDQATTHFLLTECAGQLQIETPTYAGLTPMQLARSSTFVQALVSRGALIPGDADTDDEYDSDSSEDMSYESSNVFKPALAINASA